LAPFSNHDSCFRAKKGFEIVSITAVRSPPGWNGSGSNNRTPISSFGWSSRSPRRHKPQAQELTGVQLPLSPWFVPAEGRRRVRRPIAFGLSLLEAADVLDALLAHTDCG